MKENAANTKQKRKKIAVMSLALASVSAISIGATFAYLTAKSEKVTNTFTGTSNLSIKIEEIFDAASAGNYTPGSAIQKEPYLKNICSYNEYVSMQVEYYIKNNTGDMIEVSYPEFQSIVGTDAIQWNTTDWVQAADNTSYSQFYYASGDALTSVSPEELTEKLFTSVTPDLTIESKVGASFTGKDGSPHKITGADSAGALPEFEIVLGGYAVSVDLDGEMDGSTDEHAAYQLTQLMNANPLSGFAAASDNNNKFGA